MTKIGLSDIVKATTPESNKSLACYRRHGTSVARFTRLKRRSNSIFLLECSLTRYGRQLLERNTDRLRVSTDRKWQHSHNGK